MELSPLLIYFIGQLDAFNGACGLTLVFGGIALVVINLVKAVLTVTPKQLTSLRHIAKSNL